MAIEIKKEEVEIQLPAETGEVIQQKPQEEFYPADFQPCNWSLKSEGGDLISGVNLKTGKHFNGLIAEFNNFIKGA